MLIQRITNMFGTLKIWSNFSLACLMYIVPGNKSGSKAKEVKTGQTKKANLKESDKFLK